MTKRSILLKSRVEIPTYIEPEKDSLVIKSRGIWKEKMETQSPHCKDFYTTRKDITQGAAHKHTRIELLLSSLINANDPSNKAINAGIRGYIRGSKAKEKN